MNWNELIERHRAEQGLGPDTVTFIIPGSRERAWESGDEKDVSFLTVPKDSKVAQFIHDMDDENIEWTSYSGRGMFGRQSAGVSCGGRRDVSEQEVYSATKVPLLRDSLGMGTILYVG